MFNKLLANLPYNPSLIAQISFYGKRLRQESSVRRLGFIFVTLAIIVQLFAVISPPQSSLAVSNNDLVNGGFKTQGQAIQDCQDPTQDYGKILAFYGINCSNVASVAPVWIKSTDSNRQLFSMGRIAYGKQGEQPVNIPGTNDGQPLYLRYLWSWDTGAYSSYQALSGTGTTGLHFYLLYNCGNLVFIGLPPAPAPQPTPQPVPPPPPPAPVVLPQVISCSNLVMSVADSSQVQPETQVIVRGQAAGQNIKSGQTVDMHYDYVDAVTNKILSSQQTLGVPFQGTTADDSTTHTFTTSSSGQIIIQLIVIYNGTTASGSASGDCLRHITVQSPCQAALTSENVSACLQLHKTARNVTQNIADANGTQAHAGDTIVYTLSAFNSGTLTVPKFVIQENISDILDYADVVDLHNGTQDDNHIVSWPASDIKPKQTLTEMITVKIMDPIPDTPISSSDPGHFDHKMTNVYGDTVVINLPPTIVTAVQTVNNTLPNTGPGTSVIVAFVIMLLIGYFFARSRLLAREAMLVRNEYSQFGGNL